jgi:hypothetical protein
VKGIYAPVYIDYAKVYAPPPEALAEGALPFAPKAELTVSSPEPSLAERFEAAAARLETMRKNPPDPLRWATAFENLTQARAAAARHAYDEAGTRLREAEALLRRLAPSDTALTR